MKKMVKATCDWCGVPFEKLPCELHEHNFCSFAIFGSGILNGYTSITEPRIP